MRKEVFGIFLIVMLNLAVVSAFNFEGSEALEKDYFIEVAGGHLYDTVSINKFGRSTNVDADIPTDIWDRANPVDNQPIWIPPTDSRYHTIVSTNASDNSTGIGARTIQIYGLKDWNTTESSEIIILNGTNAVNTTNAYVIIHRMRVLTTGAGGPNGGYITATAQVDGTVTAQINPGNGQTLMSIYGIPRGQSAFMTGFYFSMLKQSQSAATAYADVRISVDNAPEDEDGYLIQHTSGLSTNGDSIHDHPYRPYKRFTGPAVIKSQVLATLDNLDMSAGFDLIVEDD